ncbi:MAG: tetratricopeptide repeat protein [Candidatus Zixiibacteriota bacterium]
MRFHLTTIAVAIAFTLSSAGAGFGQQPADSSQKPPTEKKTVSAAPKSAAPKTNAGAGPANQGRRKPLVIGKPTMSLHTFPQIVEIMKKSALNYKVDTIEGVRPNTFPRDTIRPVLPVGMYISYTDSIPYLLPYKVPSMAGPFLGFAGQAYEEKKYDEAISWYRKVQLVDPKFQPTYSYLGEAYLMLDSLDSAKVNLGKAIALNFVDFESHRLMGETLWKLKDTAGAIKEMTIAHVLNLNSLPIQGELEEMRLNSGRLFFGQRIEPMYGVVKRHDTVIVQSSLGWIGYAMVKALWKYEPKYAKGMLGFDPKGSLYILQEEREGIVASLSTNKSLAFLNPIIEKGFLDEFILYDIIGPRYPREISFMGREGILRMADYVDKCQ